MFDSLTIKTEEHLRVLLKQSELALLESIQNVIYPNSLKRDDDINKWSLKYKEIDQLNKELLNNITQKAGVYALFLSKEKRPWKLLYIGQTQSKTARQRIRSHLVWRNKKTPSGKITGSQFDEVQKMIISGDELGFSFVEIHPSPLRHYIEEYLIGNLKPSWNKHKK